jgi:hypothetical protein
MTRWGATETEARARLLVALEARAALPPGQWAAGARLREIVPLWQADLDASPPAPSTRQLYAAATRLHVQPALGELRLGELTPALLDRALGQLRLRHGPQPARAARSALSSLCAAAVRQGAIPHNPVRDTRPIPCHRPQVRALTTAEAWDLQRRLRGDRQACLLDLPDLGPVRARDQRAHRRGRSRPPRCARPRSRHRAHQRHRRSHPGCRTADPAPHQDSVLPAHPHAARAGTGHPRPAEVHRSPHRTGRNGVPLPDRAAARPVQHPGRP